MHEVFTVYDVLCEIFEQVGAPTKNGVIDRKSLLSLAKTCRVFHVVVIPILWRVLNSPLPLLFCIPRSLWLLREDRNWLEAQTLIFTRRPVPEDWERFDHYARFVRKLGAAFRCEKLDPTVWQALEDRRCVVPISSTSDNRKHATAALIPNLQSLIISKDDIEFMSSFLMDGIRSLGFTGHSGVYSRRSLLSLAREIPRRCPNVKELQFDSSGSSSETDGSATFREEILTTLIGGLQLEKFTCHWFSLSDKLARLLLRNTDGSGSGRLKSLRMNMDMEKLYGLLCEMKNYPCQESSSNLSNLLTFDLSTETFAPALLSELVRLLFPSMGASDKFLINKLVRFRIYYRHAFGNGTVGRKWCNTENLCQLFEAISETSSPKHLQEIIFRYDGGGIEKEINLGMITASTLRPIYQFSRMRMVSITVHPFALTDEDVEELAKAWPELEDLVVEDGTTFTEVNTMLEDVPKRSLKSLLSLAKYCNKLNQLSINFCDVSSLNNSELRAETSSFEPIGLTKLSVGTSSTDNPARAAQFFKTVFPRLKIFHHCEGASNMTSQYRSPCISESGPGVEWREVEAQLKSMGLLRNYLD